VSARILHHHTDAEYRAGSASSVPALSQSIAKLIVNESPRHAWLRHPKLGNVPEKPTSAKDEGTLIHKLLLGKGDTDIVLIDAPDYRTKAAQQARDAALEDGKLPMIASKYKDIETAADALREQCALMGFKFKGESEVGIEWTDVGEHGDVLCRSKLDHLLLADGQILDVKKTCNANPDYIQRNLQDLGCPIQQHAYTRAVEELQPDLRGRLDFVFIFCEMEPPYSVVPVRLSGAFRAIGERQWTQALYTWERCLATNKWPSYCDGPIVLEPPAYVMAKYLGN
jgi:PDDEXK-like domain of unknown function (DUF3799)